MSTDTENETVKGDLLKTGILALLAIGLGIGVIYCVLKVGDLNGQAALLQACMDTHSQAASCTSNPVNAGQIQALHTAADTIGNIGWVAFFLLITTVGEAVMDRLRS